MRFHMQNSLIGTSVIRRLNLKAIFPLLGLVFVVLFFGFGTKGLVFSKLSLQSMLNEAVYIFIGAIGYAFVLAQGNFDLSVGSVMGVACMTAAMATKINPYLALPVGIITGSIIGLINAFVIVKAGVMAFITTLAMSFMCTGLILIISNGAVVGAPLFMLKWYTVPLKLGVILTFGIAGFFAFERSYYGKISKAIGSSIEAVRQSGTNIVLFRILPFIILGTIAGLLGFISLIRTGTASSSTGSTLMLNVLNAALLGGIPFSGGTTSKFRSVIIGTLTITIMSTGMTILGTSTVNQQLIKGLVFLVTIALSFDRKNLKVIK